MKTTSPRLGNIWETGLIWNEKSAPLVDSRATALKRLYSLEKKLDANPEYAALYYSEINRFIQNRYAEKVDDVERSRIWFLPHFGVTNPTKPGKLRLVFDAAAKISGISLNDQLDAGIDLLQSLPGVLLRFR